LNSRYLEADLPRTSFHDDNRHRRYPFVSTPEIEAAAADDQIPDSLLLDVGFTMAAYSGFDPEVHEVWLEEIYASGGALVLVFQTDCNAVASDNPLVFQLQPDTSESQVAFTESSGVTMECSSAQLIWYGFVAVGSVSKTLTWLGTHSGELNRLQHTVEPSLVQNIDKTYVRSASLANRQRTRVTDIPGVTRPYIVNSKGIQGPLRFKEGKNVTISYDLNRNGLTISAAVGSGEGKVCEELPQFDGEVSPDGGELLSGGPACRQVVKTLNGISGSRITLQGGSGILIERASDDEHKLIIRVDDGSVAPCSTGGLA